ncbi:MAG: hypothetical protein V9G19_03585 [Tetrasphaera sp.]
MNDIETRLATVLRDRAEEVTFDPAEWAARVAAAPAPPRRRWPYAAALAAAAALVGAIVLGANVRDGHDVTPPASSSTTSVVARNAPIAGAWQLARLGSAQVTDDPAPLSRIIVAENGWWRAEAGCVGVGGWLTWDPSTGLIEVGDWTGPAEPLPPPELADCYRPAILTVVQPGTTWTPGKGEVIARDAQGEETARLTRAVEGPMLSVPDRSALASSSAVLGAVANPPNPGLGGLIRAVGVSEAPWLEFGISGRDDRVTLALARPEGSGPACLVAALDARIDSLGRLTGRRARSAAGDAGADLCPATYPQEEPAIAALRATTALARGDDGTYLLGDRGVIAGFAGPFPAGGGPAVVTAPDLLAGTWIWWDDDRKAEGARVRITTASDEPDSATLSVTGTAGCEIARRVLRLDSSGQVRSNRAVTARTCPGGQRPPRPLLDVVERARAVYLDLGSIWIDGGDGRWATLTDSVPLPDNAGRAPLLERYASATDVLGRWKLTWSRQDPEHDFGTPGPLLEIDRGDRADLAWRFHGCNALSGRSVLVAGRVIGTTVGSTLMLCKPGPLERADETVGDAAAYGISIRDELLVLSRSGAPLLAFTRAG